MAQAQMTQQKKKPKTAITPTRDENFPEWYRQVIRAADFAENAPVRGCMVIKPYGFALWENIQRALDDMIKEEGVQNAYFPLLIPLSFISKEAEHVDGFAKESAIVTHHRLVKGEEGGLVPDPNSKLEEPFIIRPTSETIIGDSMAKWIQSYRDLPLKLNQWCNIMRWEMRTRMFLRTSEFLWQEGHNAFATPEEANEDARLMLKVYRKLYNEWLAMPGIPGEKTADERFPGAVHSYTNEVMMQDGKALQACTSHDLGNNFAKSFNIQYQGEDGNVHLAHTTSWGLSTRSIGGLIMTHGDDDGVIIPPKIAPHQIALLPVLRDDQDSSEVLAYCEKLKDQLKVKGIRVDFDTSDERTSNKMWAAIKKGVPLRVEVGKRDMDANAVTHTRRDLGRESQTTTQIDEFVGQVEDILADIQDGLFKKAETFQNEHVFDVKNLDELKEFFAEDQLGFVRIDSAAIEDPAFEPIKKDHAVTPRCIPFDDDGQKVIVGKSY